MANSESSKKLRKIGFTVDIIEVQTTGDKDQKSPLHEIGGKGVFIKEVEKKLLDGSADIAVHSLKDLPVKLSDQLHIGSYISRDFSSDLIIFNQENKTLYESFREKTLTKEELALLPKIRIGSGSLRRSNYLQQCNPSLKIQQIRGNIETRLRKLN